MTIAKTSKRKVATLLMNLDATTTSELLKGFPPEDIQQLVMEMAQIESSGSRDKKMEAKVVQEFCNSLQRKQTQGFNIRNFLSEMLGKLLDKQKAEELQSQVKNVLEEGDPFEAFRSAETDELLLASKFINNVATLRLLVFAIVIYVTLISQVANNISGEMLLYNKFLKKNVLYLRFGIRKKLLMN